VYPSPFRELPSLRNAVTQTRTMMIKPTAIEHGHRLYPAALLRATCLALAAHKDPAVTGQEHRRWAAQARRWPHHDRGWGAQCSGSFRKLTAGEKIHAIGHSHTLYWGHHRSGGEAHGSRLVHRGVRVAPSLFVSSGPLHLKFDKLERRVCPCIEVVLARLRTLVPHLWGIGGRLREGYSFEG